MAPVPGDSPETPVDTSMPQGGHPPHHSITSSARARSLGHGRAASLDHASGLYSVYRRAACLDRPGPSVDLGGDEFGKVFGASALDRCNIFTNRFETFTHERQIKGDAQRLIKMPDDRVRSVLR